VGQCFYPLGVWGEYHHGVKKARRTVAPFQPLVEPAGNNSLLKVRVQNNAAARCGVVQMQVVIGNAAVPVGARGAPGMLCTACSTNGIEQLACSAGLKLISLKGTWRVR